MFSTRLASSGGRFRCLRAWSMTAAVNSFAGSKSLTVIFPAMPLAARQALKLGAPDVPQLDVDTIGAALAEEEDGHGSV